jgi:hypothetical protein
MYKTEKIEFIEALVETCKQEILGKVSEMPEEWDGHELRLFVRDCFEKVVWKGTTSRARVRAYNNAVMTKGLM